MALVSIVHRAGRNYQHADALSQQLVLSAPTDVEVDLEVWIVAQISVNIDPAIGALLNRDPVFCNVTKSNLFADKQLKDPALQLITVYLSWGISYTRRSQLATRTVTQVPTCTYIMMDGILLYYTGQKGDPPM